MASGILSPPPQSGGVVAPPTEHEVLIDGRLRRTRFQVKSVDVAGGLMVLAAGSLACLLALAVVDHWVIAGGLGFWGRLLGLVFLLGAGGGYFVARVLPVLVHRINPVFAAQTIEHSRPTLKNSLINFLLLRGHRREVAPIVYRALEERAAADLATVPAETAVDRARIVRLGCVLAALVVLAFLYGALSPKSALVSFGRILWPWSNVAAPTRVQIEDVRPGDTVAFHGDTLSVSADLSGLRQDEPVTLFYSTADGQSVDQSVELSRIGQGNRYQAALPPGDLGLQQDLSYRLVAGDCNTRTFHVEVQIAPAIVVDRIDYHYPSYTGLPDRSVPGRGGDIRALEGTRATIHATANRDIQRAEIDLDGSGRRGVAMEAAGKTASGTLTLALDADDPTKPQHESYQVLFTDAQGRGNNRPIRYRIEVVRDRPPEVKFAAPEQEEVQVPVDGQLEIGVWAQDPDFGLRRVAIRAERDGAGLPIPPLLACPAPEKAWEKIFQKTYTFKPAGLGLKAGDRVTYWAEAEDNKEPVANHAETAGRRLITVVAGDHAESREGPQPHPAQRNPDQERPEAKPSPPQPEPKNGVPPGKQPPDEKVEPSPEKPEENSPDSAGAEQKPDQQPNKPGEQSTQPEEPRTNSDGSQDPDVIAKINEERQKQEQQKQQSSDKQTGDQSQSGGQKQTGDQNQSGGQKQTGDQSQSGGQKQTGDQNQSGGQKQTGDQNQPGGQKQTGDQNQSGGQKQTGDQNQSGGQKQTGDQNQSGGQKQTGDQNQSGGQKQTGDQNQSGGQKQTGDQNQSGGQKQTGDQNQSGGQKQTGDQNQSGGQKQTGDQNQSGGQKQTGDQNQSGGQKQTGDQNQSGGQKQTGDQNQSGGQKQTGDQNQSGGQKQTGDQNQSGGQKQTGDQSPPGATSGQQSTEQRPNGSPQPGSEGQLAKGSPQGAQPKPGETPGGERTGTNEQKFSGPKAQDAQQPQDSKERTGSESQDHGQNAAGAGRGSEQTTGSPPAQGENEGHDKKPGDSAQGEQHKDGQTPDSPSVSNKQSDSQGSTSGDRSGGGEKGGGQHTPKKGVGSEGVNTPSETGDSKAPQRGEGDVGTGKGDQVKSGHPTGSQAKASGAGTGQTGQQAGGTGSAEKPAGQSADNAAPDKDAGGEGASGSQSGGGNKPGVQGGGNPLTGGQPGMLPDRPPPAAKNPGGDDPNLEFARKQTDLALEYLRDQMAKDKSSLLDQLGWSREDAEGFLRRWEQMKRAAGQQGPEGAAAKKTLDEAIKSLGLRPQGTRLSADKNAPDKMEKLREGPRSEPPPEWAEPVRNYRRGVATGGR